MSRTTKTSLNGLSTADYYAELREQSPLSPPLSVREEDTILQLLQNTRETGSPVVTLTFSTGFVLSDSFSPSATLGRWLESIKRLMTFSFSTNMQPFAISVSPVESPADERLLTVRTRIYVCRPGYISVPSPWNSLTFMGMGVFGSTSQPAVRRFWDGVRRSFGRSYSWGTQQITSPDSPVFQVNSPTGTCQPPPSPRPAHASRRAGQIDSWRVRSAQSTQESRSSSGQSTPTKSCKTFQTTWRLCEECEKRITNGTVPAYLRSRIGEAFLASAQQVTCSWNKPGFSGCDVCRVSA